MNHYFERQKGRFLVSANPAMLDVNAIHAYLSADSYWAQNIPVEVVERALRGSLCLGLYDFSLQIGLARLITDRATFAYLCDVYVLPAYRGKGLSKWLMQCVFDHPDLQGLRKWMLSTKDAHGLYAQFGFKPLSAPGNLMERVMFKTYPAGFGANSGSYFQ